MTEEELKERVIILEERLKASEKALDRAQHLVEIASNNNHTLLSEVVSILAILVSAYAVFHK